MQLLTIVFTIEEMMLGTGDGLTIDRSSASWDSRVLCGVYTNQVKVGELLKRMYTLPLRIANAKEIYEEHDPARLISR